MVGFIRVPTMHCFLPWRSRTHTGRRAPGQSGWSRVWSGSRRERWRSSAAPSLGGTAPGSLATAGCRTFLTERAADCRPRTRKPVTARRTCSRKTSIFTLEKVWFHILFLSSNTESAGAALKLSFELNYLLWNKHQLCLKSELFLWMYVIHDNIVKLCWY